MPTQIHMRAPTIHRRSAIGAETALKPESPPVGWADSDAESARPGPAPWGSFMVDGGALGRGRLKLEQMNAQCFTLCSTISYYGETGLEGKAPAPAIEAVRTVRPGQLTETDLASVPTVLQWFVGRYGVHTPAALIHDRLIGLDPPIAGITDKLADRYFRFMLRDLGVPFICRWLMWAAVAFRSRHAGGGVDRYLLALWLVLATTGIGVFVAGVAAGNWWMMAGAALAPWLLSGLWGRQYGAGLVAAYLAVPWILPPTVFVAVFSGLYRIAEWGLGRLGGAWRARRRLVPRR